MTSPGVMAAVGGPSAGDQAAFAAIPRRVVAAWADRDADGFAALFTVDATMILPGVYRKGRNEIRAFAAGASGDPVPGIPTSGRPVDVRFLGPGFGLLVTEGGTAAPGAVTSWLIVKEGTVWQLAAYQYSAGTRPSTEDGIRPVLRPR